VQDGLYVALSSQIALDKRLTTIADNVANMSTVGFRASEVKFEDVVTGVGQDSVAFASPGDTYLTQKAGSLRETQNPFDFAVQGDAWFGIETPAGTVMTRDGRFTMTEAGQLVTHEGYPVLDAGGAPIQLDPLGGPPEAGRDGVIRQNGQLVASIGLFSYDPGPNFTRFGNSGVIPAGEPDPIVDRMDVGVAQGFLEESNVNPVAEMTRLIMLQRSFENAFAMTQETETTFDDAVKTAANGPLAMQTSAEIMQKAPAERASTLEALERAWESFADERALIRVGGKVSEVSATHYRVRGLSENARLGDIVEHRSRSGSRHGEIVQIKSDHVLVAPFTVGADTGIGDAVFDLGPFSVQPDTSWRGRVLNALARPIDAGAQLMRGESLAAGTPAALSRERVGTALKTGVRVIDIFTPLCFGQRIGIFAGSGVGKSTLLAMLAAADAFDTVVVALVGERGREVREFLEDTVGHKNMQKTIAVVATSDESAMMRKHAPGTAMRIAEHFRDRGDRVLLVLDSITRFAHALREVATGAGEHPVARGYPASVFTDLPKLLERAGPGAIGRGSITAVISVLVDGDDHNDPVADSVRGILDERVLVTRLRAMIARFEDTRDIRLLGAYQPGVDAELDTAVRQVPLIYEALAQSPKDSASRDPFADLARHLKSKERPNGVVQAQ
jgi:flagellum-specific ATP synthase